jgi:MYXO-CTERM domain-containing protein
MNDGATFLVAWAEPNAGIRGTFIRGSTGEVLDATSIALDNDVQPTALITATLTPAGAGKALLVHAKSDGKLSTRIIDSGLAGGVACTAALDCQSRFCVDGVCCESSCEGSCLRCGASGKCEKVLAAADPGTCAGTLACDAQGACKKALGSTCRAGDECSTGFCADGFCCNSSCDGACDVCNATPGTCTIAPEGTAGTPSCSPNRCNGADATCPTECARDDQCAGGFNCDRPTKTCIAGAVCTDEVTARAATGETTACRPYACRAGACLAACQGVQDCIQPALCDESGRCIVASDPESEGGCSTAPRDSRRTSVGWLGAFGVLLVAARRRRAS